MASGEGAGSTGAGTSWVSEAFAAPFFLGADLAVPALSSKQSAIVHVEIGR
jgi:hypothetical protein